MNMMNYQLLILLGSLIALPVHAQPGTVQKVDARYDSCNNKILACTCSYVYANPTSGVEKVSFTRFLAVDNCNSPVVERLCSYVCSDGKAVVSGVLPNPSSQS